MQVEHQAPPRVFNPVTITFETLEELKRFVEAEGKTRSDAGCVDYETWNRLANILNEYQS